MAYLTAKQFSEKWGISERRINRLCQEERIGGAVKKRKNLEYSGRYDETDRSKKKNGAVY